MIKKVRRFVSDFRNDISDVFGVLKCRHVWSESSLQEMYEYNRGKFHKLPAGYCDYNMLLCRKCGTHKWEKK